MVAVPDEDKVVAGDFLCVSKCYARAARVADLSVS